MSTHSFDKVHVCINTYCMCACDGAHSLLFETQRTWHSGVNYGQRPPNVAAVEQLRGKRETWRQLRLIVCPCVCLPYMCKNLSLSIIHAQKPKVNIYLSLCALVYLSVCINISVEFNYESIRVVFWLCHCYVVLVEPCWPYHSFGMLPPEIPWSHNEELRQKSL